MSLTEFFAGVLFKRDEHGRSVFFPNGALGGGFIVPDTATERRLRDSMMRLQVSAAVISSVAMTVVQGTIGGMAEWRAEVWFGFVVGMTAFSLLMRFAGMRLVKGLAPASRAARLGVREFYRGQAAALPRWYHWSQVAFSGSAFLIGTAVVLSGREQSVIGVPGTVTFGMIAAFSLFGLWAGYERPQAAGPSRQISSRALSAG